MSLAPPVAGPAGRRREDEGTSIQLPARPISRTAAEVVDLLAEGEGPLVALEEPKDGGWGARLPERRGGIATVQLG